MSDDLWRMTACEAARRIRERSLSPVELASAILARIEAVNPAVNAYCLVDAEDVLRQARRAESEAMGGGGLGPLHGVPVSVKDLLHVRGMRTRSGTRLQEGGVAEADSPVVARVRAAGAVILGKTTTPEFGWKAVGQSPLTGITRNPWGLDRTSGGSSAGAAAAVAAGLGPLALGSDGAGSIRVPAAFCGVFGLKPSLGRVPYHPRGGFGGASFMGPMTRTVADGALLLEVIAGYDPRDRWSADLPAEGLARAAGEGAAGLRLVWSADLGHAPVEPAVRAIVERATAVFAGLGCRVEEAGGSLPDAGPALRTQWACKYALRAPAWPGGWRDRVDPGLASLIDGAAAFTAAELAGALAMEDELYAGVQALLAGHDLLLTPTVPLPAFAAEPPPGCEIDGAPASVAGRRVPFMAWTPFTYPFNLTGHPAATVPCGWTEEGLPLGLQLVGRPGDDATVLRAAAAFEAAAPWAGRWPPLA